jgi:hypothetical protein
MHTRNNTCAGLQVTGLVTRLSVRHGLLVRRCDPTRSSQAVTLVSLSRVMKHTIADILERRFHVLSVYP